MNNGISKAQNLAIKRGLARLVRIPPYRCGDQVRVGGKVRTIRSLTCVLNGEHPEARWIVHFTDGSPHIDWHKIEELLNE